jgi:hypothetical protein
MTAPTVSIANDIRQSRPGSTENRGQIAELDAVSSAEL